MKKENAAIFKDMHWSSKLLIKYGTIIALILLLSGFLPARGSFLAISMCETAVYFFSISVISGFLFDVIAMRMGLRDKS